MKYFLGIDVGGTTSTIALGTADPSGSDRRLIYLSPQFKTQATLPPQHTIEAIIDAASKAITHLKLDRKDLVAVSLATPGPATLDGVLLRSPNLNPEYWNEYPIRGKLEKAFAVESPVPVHYIGDGQAAALGEFSVRSGQIDVSKVSDVNLQAQSINSLLMTIVGTGLGGGEVRKGQVVRGSQGRAGHVGHMLLPQFAFRYEHDRQLIVGNAPCSVESAVSLTSLAWQLGYRLTLDQWKDHPLNQEGGTDKAALREKAKQLRGLADRGDALALELFDDQARALGIALITANYLGDYDIMVVGGGVCDLSEIVRQRYKKIVEDSYREYCQDGFKNLEGVSFSICGDESPVIGSVQHAINSSVTNRSGS